MRTNTFRSKKNELKPHLQKCWVIPKEQDGDFVAAMEDVLDVYERPYNPKRPVVGDMETFRREVKAWQEARNASGKSADWQFTTEDARIKLKRLYPQN